MQLPKGVNALKHGGQSILVYINVKIKNDGFSDVYFGHKDVVVRPPDLRDADPCALDIIDTVICQQNWDLFKEKDFSLQSLIVMICRATNKEIYDLIDELETPTLHQLCLFYFIFQVYKIDVSEENDWLYKY